MQGNLNVSPYNCLQTDVNYTCKSQKTNLQKAATKKVEEASNLS
jgi:hypothetical protein